MASAGMAPIPVSFDQTADLWLKIDQFHLNYLKSDENTKKIEIRKKLEGFIHQYMSMVPQDRKFCSASTGDIIFHSCRLIPDFSAITTARAFEAIEKYAANLINQPWRKEFREIKQYGGFYMHQIKKYMIGSELLFHQMGYMSTDHEVFVLEGPIDQDRITTVARDCILAFAECQIIASIVQGVSVHFPCTWEEALIFRRDHIGTPEQAVRSLVYLKNQTHFQQGQQQQQQQVMNPMAPGMQFFPRYQAPQGYPGVVQNGINPGAFPPYGYQPQMGYYPSNGVAPQQQQMAPGVISKGVTNGLVPTANLVDVSHEPRKQDEGRAQSSDSSGSTVTGRQGPVPETVKHLEEEIRRKSMMAGVDPRTNNNAIETWDYVCGELKNIGYTKDQSEGPNVLELLTHMRMKHEQEQQHLQQQHQQQQQQQHKAVSPSFSDDHRQTSPEVCGTTSEEDSSRKYNSKTAPRPTPRHRRHEEEVDYRGDHRHQGYKQPQNHQYRHSNSASPYDYQQDVAISTTVTLPNRASRHTKPLDPPALPPKLPQKMRHLAKEPSSPQRQPSRNSTSSRHWSCRSCTYKNKEPDEICVMCAKSKKCVDSESGGCTTDDYETTNGDEEFDERSNSEDNRNGIQCAKCTLINLKTNKVCDACGASLHISPIKSDDDS